MVDPQQTTPPRPRLPLVVSPANRGESANKDARILNGYAEKRVDDTWDVFKRPGYVVSVTNTGAGAGTYNWLGDIYSIQGTTLYKATTSKGTVDGTGGVYTFSQVLGATPKLFMQNGVEAYTYDDAGGLVNVTDAQYPAATVKGSAYLDGTTYVMTAAAAILGSDINDATSWTALNTITAQIEPDLGVYLAKQLTYVIAFKQWSTEVFYDAANATGSPLGTVPGAKLNQGCRSGGSVAEGGGILFWVGQNRSGFSGVFMMEGLQLAEISTPPIERLLQQADFTTTWAFVIQLGGHNLYILTLKVANLTLVYDATSQLWYQWTDSSGNYFPFVAATFNATTQVLLQHETDGKLYLFENTTFTDNSALITFDLYTPLWDGGVRKRKTLTKLDFIADQTIGSKLMVRKSDDDYQTWSNFRTVDLSKKQPALTNCGTFQKRAYHFRHTAPTALRIQAIEMDVLLGSI